MKFKDICEICGRNLEYVTDVNKYRDMTCNFCGKSANVNVFCPANHYICDTCHSQKAIDAMREICVKTNIKDPYKLAEHIMQHPSFKMYGPEHHTLTAAVIVTCLKTNRCLNPNSELISNNDILEAINRASKVPGGYCGFYGCCGSAIGAGVAISVFTRATPSTDIPRSLANITTSKALAEIADNLEHCCKRSVKLSIKIGLDILREKFNINLDFAPNKCIFSSINPKCEQIKCPMN